MGRMEVVRGPAGAHVPSLFRLGVIWEHCPIKIDRRRSSASVGSHPFADASTVPDEVFMVRALIPGESLAGTSGELAR